MCISRTPLVIPQVDLAAYGVPKIVREGGTFEAKKVKLRIVLNSSAKKRAIPLASL